MKFNLIKWYRAIAAILIVVASCAVAEETPKSEGITWYKYDEGLKLALAAKKPVIVDFYTNWCGWCKKMDKETFADKKIVDYMNKSFIAIKVNAESKETINLPEGPTDGVKLARSYGVSSYPIYMFLDKDGKKISGLPGYQKVDFFYIVLKFISDGEYKTQNFQDYYKKNQPTK